MATYLLHDENKAAFINGFNSLLKKNNVENNISSTDLIDTPSAAKVEFTLFITEDPQEISILNQAIKDKYFSFAVKEIDLKSMVKESLKASKRKSKKSLA